jgi:F-type H+-transporting ATPase subunit delta
MSNETLAQTYAQAIFGQAIERWRDALKSINASLDKSNLIEQLDHSSTSFDKKDELIRGIAPAKAGPEVSNFVKLLASKNHVHLLPMIISEVERRATLGLQARAQVTSAVELNDAEKRLLENKLRGKFGRDAEFEYTVNPEILGGVIVRLGDKVLDGSVAGKLSALKEKLKA